MADFFVRTHTDGTGTATGDSGRYTTSQTGDWDTEFPTTVEYYASIFDALAATTPPAAGDRILCSSIHDKNWAASKTIAFGTGFVIIMSVDDANCEQYLKGALEYATSAVYDLTFSGSATHYGMGYRSGDEFNTAGQSAHIFYDCDLKTSMNSNGGFFLGTQSYLCMRGGTIESGYSTTTNFIMSASGSRVAADLCSVVITKGAGAITDFLSCSDGSKFRVNGCTIPAVTNLVDTASGYNVRVDIDNSFFTTVPTNYTTGTIRPGTEVNVRGSDDGNIEVSDYSVYPEATVEMDTSVYRSASNSVRTGFSFKFTTASDCGLGKPFRYKIATLFRVNTATAKTFTAQFNRDNGTDLTDAEIFLEVLHSDDTTTATHRETDQPSDWLNGTAQADSTEGWSGTGGFGAENKQACAVTTAQTGKAGIVDIYINILVPSETIYVCPDIDVT